MATDNRYKIKRIAGLNNVDLADELSPEEMRVVENLDITNRGWAISRKGSTELIAGDFHSLGGSETQTLVVEGGELKLLSLDAGTLSTLRTGINETRTMSYAVRNEDVYYSNGFISGYVSGGSDAPWATPKPNTGGVLTATVGGLPPGEYHVAVTHIDSRGRESAAKLSGGIKLTSQGGIRLSNLEATLYDILVYMTNANGEVFSMQGTLVAGSTQVELYGHEQGRTLQTLNRDALPAGEIIAVHAGRLLSAQGSVLWYEEAFTHGLCRKARNYVSFRDDITMVAPVEDGVFVSADRLYFLKGRDPVEFTLDDRGPMRAVKGTDVVIPGAEAKREGVDHQHDAVAWTSDRGVYMGYSDGSVINMTESRYSYPVGETGAAMFRRENGASQYVTTLKEPNDGRDGFAVTDRVVAEVYRNGILVT